MYMYRTERYSTVQSSNVIRNIVRYYLKKRKKHEHCFLTLHYDENLYQYNVMKN